MTIKWAKISEEYAKLKKRGKNDKNGQTMGKNVKNGERMGN